MSATKKSTQRITIEALKNLPLFDTPDIGVTHFRKLATICREEEAAAGKRIFSEGQLGARLYVVLEGTVQISIRLKHGGESTLATLKKGDFFGEMALLGDGLRSADATAVADCRLLTIQRDDLKRLLAANPDLGYAVLWGFCHNLARRLCTTTERMKSFVELVAGF